jgi:nucleoid-associated protein YgaU
MKQNILHLCLIINTKKINIMGLFSFIKNAGAKVFGIGKTTEQVAEDKAAKLLESVEKLGFKVRDLNIEVADETVKVWGQAETQEEKEKVILVLGNTEGIATVDDNITVITPKVESKFYTVEKGDSLSKIAKAMYGDAMKYPVIFEANKPMLKDPDLIYPGQVLRIPTLD